jgi:hypothetical protein
MSIEIMNSILSIKFGTTISLTPETSLLLHPTDLIGLSNYMKSNPGKTLVDYLPLVKYEDFEIRSDNKVYSHILKGTIDTTNQFFLQFETDTDLNTSTMVLGAPSAKSVTQNGVKGEVRRRVIIDYKSIDSIEFIKIKAI